MKRKTILFVLLMALFAPLAMQAQTRETLTFDFEDNTIPSTWTNDANYPWEVTSAKNHTTDGAFCIKSTNVGVNSSTSSIEATFNFSDDGTISFYCFASCENASSYWDYGIFYIDGTQMDRFLDVTDWVAKSYELEAGQHTFKWSYTKDSSAESNDDCFYVDDIVVDLGEVPACPKPTGVTGNNTTAHGATVSWTGSSDSYILMLGQLNIVVNYDFESNSIPSAFTNSTSYPWTVVANTHSGAYCVKSGNAGVNSSTSDLVLELTLANAGSVSFSARASSEGGYDYGRFLIDGTQQFQTSGAYNSWTDYSYDLAAGTHTLTWRFYKDFSNAGGDDCFYVDDIVINENPSSWDETHTASASPYTFTDLDPETSYMVMVKGVCGSEQSEPSTTVVSFTTLEGCATPQNLAVTTNGETATVTWTGTEGTCNISVNGIVTNEITSPYTFNVDISTTYEVRVQTNCDGETGNWTEAYIFTTPSCVGGYLVEYVLTDTYGNGWDGSAIIVSGACDIIETLANENLDGTTGEETQTGSLTLCEDYYQFTWQTGSYASEVVFSLIVNGTPVYTNQSGSDLGADQVLLTLGTAPPAKPTNLTAGTPDIHEVELSWTENGTATAWELCINGDETNPVAANSNPFTLTGLTPDTDYTIKVRSINGSDMICWTDEIAVHTDIACARPEDLDEANITYTTVVLSWTGTSDSYVAQYGTWTQVGTDHITTATLTPYTFDLSNFSGNGTVAIRHYNVTDMFLMNVDDIVVRNASNEIVYSQDFESGSVPSNMSNIDLDGDNHVWGIWSSNVNGSYGVSSQSWESDVALTPDNWLVIPDVQLGGSITFYAIGQDPSAVSENFGVFVIADSQFIEAYSGTNTSCQLTGLTEGTPYVWRVKGICGEEPSRWVSSIFKTEDDLLVFTTNGAWNNVSNWTDADGNAVSALPTVDNKVRIDAKATIASGVVATAKSAVLNGGSIEIEEGGQLKQGSTVKVTMHKGITGYGAGNEALSDHWYFISTPHSCSYFEENTLFPYVLNVTDGEYDLYAFDPTADLEWINFEHNSNHSEFHTGDNTGLFNKKGYLYANEVDKDLTFVGTVSSSLNNTLTESYTYNGDATYNCNGWKLVGNPFTCNAYISYVDAEGNALEADFYVMNSEGTGFDELSSSAPLAPCTGALINYSATGKIQYSTEVPAKSNGTINMNLSNGYGKVDMARVRFGEGFNLGKKSFRDNSSKLFMSQNGEDYAVVYADNEGEMPVSFKAEKNGSYALSFHAENVELCYLHLIDNLTGNDIDLLATPSYTFNALTTDYASRFKLVFSTGSDADDDFAFISNGEIIVNGEGTLQVIDVTGRVIRTVGLSQCGSRTSTAGLMPGVYVLRLINGDNAKTQKMVINQ